MFCSPKTILQIICTVLILFSVFAAGAKIKSIRENRIVGGTKVSISKVPYIVQIRDDDNDAYCGGTLIASKYVITAAHCIDGMDTKTLTVVAGASTVTDTGVSSKIANASMHPDYKNATEHSDVAVVELATALSGTNIQTIPLCKRALKKGDFIQISGWGYTKYNVSSSAHDLHTVRLSVTTQEQCEDDYGDDVKKNIFCASAKEPKGLCEGDSGGPAVFGGRLCGVNAFTDKCGTELDLQGFIDINRVRDFIDTVMGVNALKN